MFRKTLALLAFCMLSTAANADELQISGAIDSGTGALIGLAPPGTAYTGTLDWGGTALDGALVILGGFCFADDASGTPPSSPSCMAPLAAVPLLVTGPLPYTGALPPPGSTFEQPGTTFSGFTGVLKIIAFSPTFVVNIAIDLTFNGDGSGSVFADAGALGTATGSFVVTNFTPPGGPSSGDSTAIPTMPWYGLVFMALGMILTAQRWLRRTGRRN